jgi:predicted ATPase
VDAEIANRLADLVDGVRQVRVDLDAGRKLLRLMMTDDAGVELPASSLSDGTLRFIALAIMESDPAAVGVLCLEEPENGIHPQRVAAMLELLADMAVETSEPVGEENPLRQVITTTHSPVVVRQAIAGDVLFARPKTTAIQGRAIRGLELVGLGGTWRDGDSSGSVALGTVMAFLGAIQPADDLGTRGISGSRRRLGQLVDEQLQLPGLSGGEG